MADEEQMKSVSLLILNWNGEKVIAKCLRSALDALDHYQGRGEVLVVDNGSKDKSVTIIKGDYPQARLICLKENLGFSVGNNLGVKESHGDIVVLLNNDAYVHPDFLTHLTSHFDNDQVFSVNPKVYGPDGLIICRTSAYFHRGIIKSRTSRDVYSVPVPCLFASAGVGAFDKGKYLELGGLLDLLYWEDFELGYRAWKRKGWQTIYEPRSLVYHDFGTSFGKIFTQKELKNLSIRNRFLFQWYAISDPSLIMKHVGSLPFVLIYFLSKGKMSFPIGFIQALLEWGQFKKQVRQRVPKCGVKLRDREVLEIVKGRGW
jgi:GT2 family glycosyltransferase